MSRFAIWYSSCSREEHIVPISRLQTYTSKTNLPAYHHPPSSICSKVSFGRWTLSSRAPSSTTSAFLSSIIIRHTHKAKSPAEVNDV
ncbi:hypothetical protein K491DRAFT_508692 [Lophiostoma macrostomum CBS 122681]|uniref:Uncharacterized protein n=1 Tax=Lophiostoma macrostomum CBS 122681 TaxID=1314788 RepID=A0A6A6T3F5_9PLEO|nr:hypothetical protein K491DRAFT_508692 [Lophiostoma macrostomum CBS 122681]